MTDDPYATRREFDALANMVGELRSRQRRIEETMYGPVVLLQAQMTQVIGDASQLRRQMEAEFREHRERHEEEERARAAGRRWLIGIGFAGVTAFASLYPFILLVVGHHLWVGKSETRAPGTG